MSSIDLLNGPRVSVLTPSYNQARWLRHNLRSVAQQTYPYIEHIVMDGGSTDGSVDILRDEAGPRVRWRSEPDRGQSDALNKAFAESRGAIIGWLNSDDAYFDAGVVQAVVRVFLQRPDVDVVYGHAVLVDADGLILRTFWLPPRVERIEGIRNILIQPAVFFRRTALGRSMVDESYTSAMDLELWLRLRSNHKFHRLNRILAIDRHHKGRKSFAQRDVARAELRRLVVEYALPRAWWVPLAAKAITVGCRLMGLSLVTRSCTQNAFDGCIDSPTRLYWRQLAMPLRKMPI